VYKAAKTHYIKSIPNEPSNMTNQTFTAPTLPTAAKTPAKKSGLLT